MFPVEPAAAAYAKDRSPGRKSGGVVALGHKRVTTTPHDA